MTINSHKVKQHLHHIHIGIWKILFGLIWEQQNIFIHGKDSITMEYEHTQLENELIKWQRVVKGAFQP